MKEVSNLGKVKDENSFDQNHVSWIYDLFCFTTVVKVVVYFICQLLLFHILKYLTSYAL